MVKPSDRKQMAQHAVTVHGVSVRQACQIFVISECCYRYRPALYAENQQIADWLIRITNNQRNWGLVCVTCIYAM